MVPLLLLVASVGAVTSILPFVFPGAVIGLFGVVLNHWLGEVLAALFGLRPGWLLVGGSDGFTLSLPGVLVVYLPLIVVLSYAQRGR